LKLIVFFNKNKKENRGRIVLFFGVNSTLCKYLTNLFSNNAKVFSFIWPVSIREFKSIKGLIGMYVCIYYFYYNKDAKFVCFLYYYCYCWQFLIYFVLITCTPHDFFLSIELQIRTNVCVCVCLKSKMITYKNIYFFFLNKTRCF